ncbi:hypothetical protein PGTUg99_002639 [Puccinia graminis f. sp. tritici]|uniref:SLM1/RGC1-like BAR-like domain-containing protein n=1 Tax=Puccinia graminis f. sp. tritici TaxID=56615 RepID=A0A5B0RNX9_PUCGR|nr:hypothetical protein PGTUg99_002639 [Puccinia graminis f. sp. tritici]
MTVIDRFGPRSLSAQGPSAPDHPGPYPAISLVISSGPSLRFPKDGLRERLIDWSKHEGGIGLGSGSAEHADQTEHKEVDILFDRFLEYKSITKGLISYYEDLARLETHTASEMVNIGGHLPVPLREGNQFLPEGGWQSILYDTREQTRAMADYHTTFAHTITHSVLHTLNHVKNDIKIFITDLENEPRALASEVGQHRVDSTRLLSQLAQGIAHSKSNPHAMTAKDDPVLIHRQVEAQLKAQLNFENSLTHMIIGKFLDLLLQTTHLSTHTNDLCAPFFFQSTKRKRLSLRNVSTLTSRPQSKTLKRLDFKPRRQPTSTGKRSTMVSPNSTLRLSGTNMHKEVVT